MKPRRKFEKLKLIPLFLVLLPLPSFLNASEGQAYVKGQKVILLARVSDEFGNPLQNVKVHFQDDTDNIYLGSAISDEEGVASISWDTSEASTGLHTIHVWNEEQEELYLEESHSYLQLRIKAGAELSYSIISPGAVRPGESFFIIITVKNLGEASIEDVEIILGEEKRKIGTIEGEKASKASFTFRAPSKAGNYVIQGTIKGLSLIHI